MPVLQERCLNWRRTWSLCLLSTNCAFPVHRSLVIWAPLLFWPAEQRSKQVFRHLGGCEDEVYGYGGLIEVCRWCLATRSPVSRELRSSVRWPLCLGRQQGLEVRLASLFEKCLWSKRRQYDINNNKQFLDWFWRRLEVNVRLQISVLTFGRMVKPTDVNPMNTLHSSEVRYSDR